VVATADPSAALDDLHGLRAGRVPATTPSASHHEAAGDDEIGREIRGMSSMQGRTLGKRLERLGELSRGRCGRCCRRLD
jgi:hypothetical protein